MELLSKIQERLLASGSIAARFRHGEGRARRRATSATPRRAAAALLRAGRGASRSGPFWRRSSILLFAAYLALFVVLPFPPALILLGLLLSCWAADVLVGRVSDFTPGSLSSDARESSGGSSRTRSGTGDIRRGLTAYLFGSSRAGRIGKQTELANILSLARARRGILSLEEIMTLTGESRSEADRSTIRFLEALRGEPAVTKCGTVVYRFDRLSAADLPASSVGDPTAAVPARGEPAASEAAPAGITGESQAGLTRERPDEAAGPVRSTNASMAVNASNLVLGLCYGLLALGRLQSVPAAGQVAGCQSGGLWSCLNGIHSLVSALQVLDSVPTVALIVGLVPAGVASILSALHLFARLRDRRSERRTRERALRKLVYSHVLSHPNCVDPEAIGGRGSDAAVTRILDELAGAYGADIEEIGTDHYLYRFREIAREMRELAEARATETGGASSVELVVPSSSRY